MRRGLITLLVLAAFAVLAPAALATTQTTTKGAVTATFTYKGRYPNYTGLHLTIAQSGSVLYNAAVTSKACGKFCAPGATGAKESSLQIIDLDHIGQPNVILNLYSGGAHCCSLQQLFTFDPGTMTYAETEYDFGDPGARIEDLNHDGRFEFVTADDRFAYAFTDFAASGLPLQILTFTGSRFQDVTDSYPALIRKDAATWLKTFKQIDHGHDIDSVGVIAAWAADEYRLGKAAAANRYLHQQAQAGHLKSALGGAGAAQGQKFVAKLQTFLRRHGYGH
ncbi:MAG TPA: hypothetical protein VNV17_02560 [Solirubrobacteraceae bacterium]|nr:hypothetical protein [Solirubrobacteraceae bacterium]